MQYIFSVHDINKCLAYVKSQKDVGFVFAKFLQNGSKLQNGSWQTSLQISTPLLKAKHNSKTRMF